MPKVDVAMCVYGKPYNAAVTLASLARFSSHHIGRVFIQEDGAQPHGETVDYFHRCFPEMNVTQHIPDVVIGNAFPDFGRIDVDDAYRRSMRYQYAWETTGEDYLFITHNDCLFSEDIIGNMAAAMGSTFSGAGMIGQCWNCPAYYAALCHGTTFGDYRPSYEEAVDVVRRFPGPRTFAESIHKDAPMPLPECRLNEFACLINVSATREHVYPLGPILPFGALTLDTGSDWFQDLVRLGHRFVDYRAGFVHAPFSTSGSGDPANHQLPAYEAQEARASDHLRAHYTQTWDRIGALRAVTRTLRGLATA